MAPTGIEVLLAERCVSLNHRPGSVLHHAAPLAQAMGIAFLIQYVQSSKGSSNDPSTLRMMFQLKYDMQAESSSVIVTQSTFLRRKPLRVAHHACHEPWMRPY